MGFIPVTTLTMDLLTRFLTDYFPPFYLCPYHTVDTRTDNMAPPSPPVSPSRPFPKDSTLNKDWKLRCSIYTEMMVCQGMAEVAAAKKVQPALPPAYMQPPDRHTTTKFEQLLQAIWEKFGPRLQDTQFLHDKAQFYMHCRIMLGMHSDNDNVPANVSRETVENLQLTWEKFEREIQEFTDRLMTSEMQKRYDNTPKMWNIEGVHPSIQYAFHKNTCFYFSNGGEQLPLLISEDDIDEAFEQQILGWGREEKHKDCTNLLVDLFPAEFGVPGVLEEDNDMDMNQLEIAETAPQLGDVFNEFTQNNQDYELDEFKGPIDRLVRNLMSEEIMQKFQRRTLRILRRFGRKALYSPTSFFQKRLLAVKAFLATFTTNPTPAQRKCISHVLEELTAHVGCYHDLLLIDTVILLKADFKTCPTAQSITILPSEPRKLKPHFGDPGGPSVQDPEQRALRKKHLPKMEFVMKSEARYRDFMVEEKKEKYRDDRAEECVFRYVFQSQIFMGRVVEEAVRRDREGLRGVDFMVDAGEGAAPWPTPPESMDRELFGGLGIGIGLEVEGEGEGGMIGFSVEEEEMEMRRVMDLEFGEGLGMDMDMGMDVERELELEMGWGMEGELEGEFEMVGDMEM